MTIPTDYIINDIRTNKDFNVKTFSGYLLTDVYKGLFKSIDNYKIEETCNWTTELIVSGQTDKLYDKFIQYYCKYINVNNPQLPQRILKRYKMYIDGKINNKEAVNIQAIRNHLIEMAVLFCLSNKHKPLSFPKVTEADYTNEIILKKLKANSKSIDFKPDDPQELRIVINELWYHIRNKNMPMVLYWIKWIMVYEKQLNKKKKQLICAERYIADVPKKFRTNYVWIIWEILMNESHTHIAAPQIASLYGIYSKNYKKSTPIFILLNAIQYFIDTYNYHKPICGNYNILIQATAKINYLFQKKKQYETLTGKSVDVITKTKPKNNDANHEQKLHIVFDIDNYIMKR
jgi:hypothetical protein